MSLKVPARILLPLNTPKNPQMLYFLAFAISFPGLSNDDTYIYYWVGALGIIISNWLLNALFVFIIKYLIIYHNLMQLTDIDEREILLKIRFNLWILSFLLELLDGIFVSDVK